MRKVYLAFAMVIVLFALPLSGAAAPTTPELFGAASYNATGVVLTSSSTVDPGFAGISFPAFAGVSLSSITSLGASYQMTTGDCGVGSPRYVISFSDGTHIFAYFGDAPNYHCGDSLRVQSDLTHPNVDTSQLAGGTFYDTWEHALELAGTRTVTGLSIVLDGGNQVAEIFSASINGTTYNFAAPTSKEQCKKGGWQNFINPGAFKNQGDCIQFVNTGK